MRKLKKESTKTRFFKSHSLNLICHKLKVNAQKRNPRRIFSINLQSTKISNSVPFCISKDFTGSTLCNCFDVVVPRNYQIT